MTSEQFQEIFDSTQSEWEGDNAFQGLLIIAKYIDPAKTDIIIGAEHDEIFSVDIDKLIDAGITEEDVLALAKLNWGHQDGYLMCFV
jgi:hypothetical protein